MAYLNLDLDYFDHPKTVRLVGLLGKGADLLPIRLWCYCGKYHAEKGELTDYLPEAIESAINWWGQPGRAVEALLQPFQGKPGFLERIENGFKVHDWEKINGHIAALKERASAAAIVRWEKYRKEHAQAMPELCSSIAPSNALSFPSIPTNNTPYSPPMGDAGEKKIFEKGSDPYEAAQFWFKHLDKWTGEPKNPTEKEIQKAAVTFEQMFREDKLSPADFTRLLNWIAKHEKKDFRWRDAIRTPKNLRGLFQKRKFVGFKTTPQTETEEDAR